VGSEAVESLTITHIIYFTGGNLDGLVNQYAPMISQYAGKIKMRFLFVTPESKMEQAIEIDADPIKKIDGRTLRAMQTLVNWVLN
jgi:hypothetical protein